MSESFVDLTYRGLSLGRRVKLSDVRPTTGYVEMPAPMPVGTQIGIITDDTVALDAIVVEVHEQISGSDRPPGMVVKPRLEGDAGKSWWQKRVSLPEPEKKQTPVSMLAAVPPAPVVVHGKRMTNPGIGVPEIVDDGHDTGVMDAIEMPTEPVPPIQDDGKQTVAMDAVDLKALGLSTSTSQEMPAVKADDDDDSGGTSNGNGNGNGERPSDPKIGGRRKRKKR